mgnify:FL=1
MRKLFGVMALTGVLAAAPAALVAQQPFHLGAQVSWGDDSDVGIGVRYENDLNRLIPARNLRVIGSFDWFFPGNNVDYFEINANVAYQFTLPGSRIGPYVGGGLNIARASVDLPVLGKSSDTQVGLNLLGGLRFPSAGRIRPYVEGRFELSGGEQFVLTGGLLFF